MTVALNKCAFSWRLQRRRGRLRGAFAPAPPSASLVFDSGFGVLDSPRSAAKRREAPQCFAKNANHFHPTVPTGACWPTPPPAHVLALESQTGGPPVAAPPSFLEKQAQICPTACRGPCDRTVQMWSTDDRTVQFERWNLLSRGATFRKQAPFGTFTEPCRAVPLPPPAPVCRKRFRGRPPSTAPHAGRVVERCGMVL